jgi:AcrR family transcriptional regulator
VTGSTTGQDTKTRILDIARELFARKGFTGTSISDIARELGTTTAALYYHFPSKAGILRGLLAEPLAAYARIVESLDTAQPSPEALLGALIDLAAESRELGQIIDREPATVQMLDQYLPLKPEEMTGAIVAALAGPDPGHGAVIRAHAAFSVAKGATMAALELSGDAGDALKPADRAEILAAALRTLQP